MPSHVSELWGENPRRYQPRDFAHNGVLSIAQPISARPRLAKSSRHPDLPGGVVMLLQSGMASRNGLHPLAGLFPSSDQPLSLPSSLVRALPRLGKSLRPFAQINPPPPQLFSTALKASNSLPIDPLPASFRWSARVIAPTLHPARSRSTRSSPYRRNDFRSKINAFAGHGVAGKVTGNRPLMPSLPKPPPGLDVRAKPSPNHVTIAPPCSPFPQSLQSTRPGLGSKTPKAHWS
ncbi:hypothetical protein FNV43_RR06084 [Rhamnella rubrinervis]|uniref:Uncharacterized protein n=1 Tax=Rhamnella rubrinervis TaxID=2594499 RepID=A0A8K0MLM7_9ROSA|nr:hypothetical protein FNV43_RR06084 [Rhamnella rubrinervis]